MGNTQDQLQRSIDSLSEDKLLLLKGFYDYLNSQNIINHDNRNIMELLPFVLKLQNEKESQYGRSWCKHRDLSAYFNLERKWDRIENIMKRIMNDGLDTLDNSEKSSTPTETFLDTIVDLGVYSFMWVGLIKELRPEQFEKFININKL